MKIGIVPGAMKPYHAGHHYLVESALAECDMVTILTTKKNRKGISGDSMYEVWTNYIIPHLQEKHGTNIQIRFVVSPIRTVYEDFIERLEAEGSDGHKYRIYGGTEDNGRFQSHVMAKKYPTAALYITNVAEAKSESFQRGTGKSPMAKGEWIRQAITENNKKRFASMMPAFLQPNADEILKSLKS